MARIEKNTPLGKATTVTVMAAIEAAERGLSRAKGTAGTVLAPDPQPGRHGRYTAAIEAWEVATGRSAPAPTTPFRDGRRLSPVFAEWMMGLPEGWVTDTDTSWSQQLKMLGNGVVPQQAAAAIRELLAELDEPA